MIVRMGDRGEAVATLQSQLKDRGFLTGTVDGIFGAQTDAALREFQESEGLSVDGLAGPRTFEALAQECHDSKRITDQDYAAAAAELQVEQAAVRAFAEVESNGSGFMADGRPRILFERHWMSRLLKQSGVDVGQYGAHLDDIINTTPGGYIGGAGEWRRFNRAKAIHRPAAIQSASWGKFQILGVNYRRAGYSSVESFYAAMCRNEGEHLLAVIRFIKTDQALHKAIQEYDWKEVARRYNGPKYYLSGYDQKLEEAFLNWQERLA